MHGALKRSCAYVSELPSYKYMCVGVFTWLGRAVKSHVSAGIAEPVHRKGQRLPRNYAEVPQSNRYLKNPGFGIWGSKPEDWKVLEEHPSDTEGAGIWE